MTSLGSHGSFGLVECLTPIFDANPSTATDSCALSRPRVVKEDHDTERQQAIEINSCVSGQGSAGRGDACVILRIRSDWSRIRVQQYNSKSLSREHKETSAKFHNLTPEK